jgi:hypothetical protein
MTDSNVKKIQDGSIPGLIFSSGFDEIPKNYYLCTPVKISSP